MGEIGLQKTLVFLVFIFIGVFLKVKFRSKEEIVGIKHIILNLALPATIFIALLGIEVKVGLLLLPVLALVLNLLLFVTIPLVLPLVGIQKNTGPYRTARLLLPSLAPGLSCFPFVLEFLGEAYLAKAAMADLGNKIFVLIALYWIAMQWHFKNQSKTEAVGKSKVKELLKVLVCEPVNLFIIAALLLLGFGVTLESLPFFMKELLTKLSLVMTPLVLLFIGLSVRIKRKQLLQIFSLLCTRAGIVLCIVALATYGLGSKVNNDILLMMAFSLSACSFWPYAHISAVDALELESKPNTKTFNNDFAIAILALSFPFSTILVLATLNSGTLFYKPGNIIIAGLLLIVLGIVYPVFKTVRERLGPRKVVSPELEHSTS